MSLSPDQERALASATAGRNTVICGGAGTGKSFLVEQIIKNLPARPNGDPRRYYKTSTTGASAVHINGVTVHSWAGIGLGTKRAKDLYKNIKKKRPDILANWLKTDVLFLDEVSMCSAHLFNILDKLGRKIRGKEMVPFGGMQLICIGDFRQCPPIEDKEIPLTGNFCFESERWAKTFRKEDIHVLTTNHRQKTDPEFAAVLNDVAEGVLSKEGRRVLSECVRPAPPGDEYTHLYSRRIDAEARNRSKLAELKGELFAYKYNDVVRPNTFSDSAPLCEQLKGIVRHGNFECKIGALVLLTKNLCVEEGWANGTMCRVLGADSDSVTVMRVDGDPEDEDSIRVIEMTKCDVVESWRGTAFRMAMPLVLAWGITIHKSQGMSLQRGYVNVTHLFAPGQAYVALSRFFTREHLYLSGIPRIRVSPAAIAFYNEHTK